MSASPLILLPTWQHRHGVRESGGHLDRAQGHQLHLQGVYESGSGKVWLKGLYEKSRVGQRKGKCLIRFLIRDKEEEWGKFIEKSEITCVLLKCEHVNNCRHEKNGNEKQYKWLGNRVNGVMGKVRMGLFRTNLHFPLLSKLSRSLTLPTASDPKHETKIYFRWNYLFN